MANDLEKEFGMPIINKRISVTPISLIAETCSNEKFVRVAETLEKAAEQVGVNFIGGFSTLVHKGFTKGDINLIESIPYALSSTERLFFVMCYH